MTSPDTDRDRALAVMRRGHWGRLNTAIAQFKILGENPKKGDYKMTIDALKLVEKAMRAANQEP